MRPSGDTNDALQPPSETIAPIGWPVRSANAFGSPEKPMVLSFGARSGICCGIHMPSSERAGKATRKPRQRIDDSRRKEITGCLLERSVNREAPLGRRANGGLWPQ